MAGGNAPTSNTEDTIVRIAKEAVPFRINVPGAIARQEIDFGDVSGYGGAEFFSACLRFTYRRRFSFSFLTAKSEVFYACEQ